MLSEIKVYKGVMAAWLSVFIEGATTKITCSRRGAHDMGRERHG